MDAEEPRYVGVGEEFGDSRASKPPKWRQPSGDFQLGLFRVTHRKYWPNDKEGKRIRSRYIEIEKSLVPLKSGIVAEYPEEWVKQCFEWAEEKNRKAGYPAIGLKALLSLIENKDRRNDFVREYKRKERESGRTDRRD